jgi:hypothetical protein
MERLLGRKKPLLTALQSLLSARKTWDSKNIERRKLHEDLTCLQKDYNNAQMSNGSDTPMALKVAAKNSYLVSRGGGRGSLEEYMRSLKFREDYYDHLAVREIEKMGKYWGFVTDLVRICRHPEFRRLFYRVEIDPCKPFGPIRPPGSAIVCYVHAEVQLMLYYEQNVVDIHPRVIGSSKAACYLCDSFIRHHGRFRVPRSHNQLYSQWAIPEVLWLSQESKTRLRLVIKRMLNEMHPMSNNIYRHNHPYVPQSKVNILGPEYRNLASPPTTDTTLSDVTETLDRLELATEWKSRNSSIETIKLSKLTIGSKAPTCSGSKQESQYHVGQPESLGVRENMGSSVGTIKSSKPIVDPEPPSPSKSRHESEGDNGQLESSRDRECSRDLSTETLKLTQPTMEYEPLNCSQSKHENQEHKVLELSMGTNSTSNTTSGMISSGSMSTESSDHTNSNALSYENVETTIDQPAKPLGNKSLSSIPESIHTSEATQPSDSTELNPDSTLSNTSKLGAILPSILDMQHLPLHLPISITSRGFTIATETVHFILEFVSVKGTISIERSRSERREGIRKLDVDVGEIQTKEMRIECQEGGLVISLFHQGHLLDITICWS